MSDEPTNTTSEVITPKAKSSNPDIGDVILAISEGSYDGSFESIEQAMNDRREARKEAVMAEVREVFGDDYVVRASMPPMASMVSAGAPMAEDPEELLVSEPTAQERLEDTNPFFRNRRPDPFEGQDEDEGVTNPSEPTDNVTTPVQNAVERQMVEQQGIEALPIEQRGAIIGGLSSSDMGD